MRHSVVLAILLLAAAPARAEPAISFGAAWSVAAEKGADTDLYLVAHNTGAADAIVRVRCDAANFTEMRTVDRGEGFPSARTIKAIPIAANDLTTLDQDGLHIRLLQLTHPVAPGDRFECVLRLRGGSQQTISVETRSAG